MEKRSEASDEYLRQAATSCTIGLCLCGHGPPSRCPCGAWRGTWREHLSGKCPACGRPGWCER